MPIVNSSKINVNKRYVFFNSLPQQRQPMYHILYQQGMQYVQEAQLLLENQGELNDTDYLMRIEQYVKMVGKLAETEKNNEIFFIKNWRNIIKADKLNQLPADFKKFADQLEEGQPVNYLKLIASFNNIMQISDQFSKLREETTLNNMKVITENFEQSEEEIKKEIEDAEKTNMARFHKEVNNKLLETIQIEGQKITYKTPVLAAYAEKFNSVLFNIVDNPKYLQKIGEAFSNKNTCTEDYIKTITIGAIWEILRYNLDPQTIINSPGKELANIVIDKFEETVKNLSFERAKEIIKIIDQQVSPSIEKRVLLGHRGVGKDFLLLTLEEREALLKKFKIENDSFFKQFLEKDINEIIQKYESKGGIKKLRENISKKLSKVIEEYIEKQTSQTLSKNKQARKQLIADIEQGKKYKGKLDNFFTNRNSIADNLKVKVKGSSLAELDLAAMITSMINGKTSFYGKTRSKKTDVSIGSIELFWDKLNLDKFKDKKTTTELRKKLENFGENFLINYDSASKGINVKIAQKIMEEQIKEINGLVETLTEHSKNKEKAQKEIYEQLNKLIDNAIQVKEYNYGSNQFGFEGESLGFNAQMQLINIQNMYEEGGLSHEDLMTLYFVIMNCGEDGIAKNLKLNLEHYLLAGAAMIMFDHGFGNAEKFMNRILDTYKWKPKFVHLYHIQTTFIPASLVLSNIYNNLIDIYNDLAGKFQKIENIPITNNILDIQNNITWNYYKENVWEFYGETDGQEASPFNKPQYRWDYVKNDANFNTHKISTQDLNINLRFSFVGGVLDILENLKDIFKNPI